jgi:hypothetical protein
MLTYRRRVVVLKKEKANMFERIVQLPPEDSGLGNNIVRLNNSWIDSKKRNRSLYFRRNPVVIKNTENGQKIVRYVMGSPGGFAVRKGELAIDYDGMDMLGVQRGHECHLLVKRANIIESLAWLVSHPDLNVSLSIRFALLGAALGMASFVQAFFL